MYISSGFKIGFSLLSCSAFFTWTSSGFRDFFFFVIGSAAFSSIIIGLGLVKGFFRFKSLFEGVRDYFLGKGLYWQSLTKSSEIGSSFGF